MKKDITSIGGPEQGFPTTRWTELESPCFELALARISRRYWKPLYYHLRHKGWSNEKAKDIIQGFFSDVVMGRGLIQKADRRRGRFRTFLLTALDNYGMPNVYRHERHVPQPTDLPADEIPAALTVKPQDAFSYAWAAATLDDTLAAVEKQCVESGQQCVLADVQGESAIANH